MELLRDLWLAVRAQGLQEGLEGRRDRGVRDPLRRRVGYREAVAIAAASGAFVAVGSEVGWLRGFVS